jgi:hypothetical protein
MNQDAEFPARHWEEIRSRVETGGAESVVEFARSFEDPRDRRKVLAFAQQALVQRDWKGKDLAPCLSVARAAIDEVVDQARRLTDVADVMSYNLAADLAPCWPGDDLPRTPELHRAGLGAARDCVRWREELGKPPRPRSMAWWAKGIHELALGEAEDAVASFGRALAYAEEAGAAFDTTLCRGYLGLAETAAGRDGGRETYETALGSFREQVEAGGEAKDDAAFGLEQLETARGRLVH